MEDVTETVGEDGEVPAAVPRRRSWITQGSLFKAALRLAMPMMVMALLEDLYSLVDLAYVGRLGPAAVAAVSIGGSVMGVLYMLGIGIATGCGSLVAQAVGAGDRARAERVASQGLMMAVVLSAALGAMGVPLAGHFVRGLGAKQDVLTQGTAYLQIGLGGAAAMLLSVAFVSALRGAGDTVTPLIMIGAGVITNIVLDPIMIFGWFGFPAMGVAGSALATLIARLLAASLLARVFFLRGHEHFHLHLRDLKPDRRTIGQMLRIGVFGSGQGLARNVSNLVLFRVVAGFGEIALAAYGIGLRLRMALMMPGMGFGAAATTLVGQNLGAGDPDRAEKAGWLAAGSYSAVAAVISVTFWVLAERIVAAFNDDPAVVSMGSSFLRWFATCFTIMAFTMVLGRGMHGAGDTLWPMLLTTFSLLILRIPLACGLAGLWNSVTGVWAGITISIGVEGVLAISVFRWGRWKTIGARHLRAAAVASMGGEGGGR